MAGNVLAAEPKYDRVRVVLGDKDPTISGSIEKALGSRGLNRVKTCTASDQLYDSLDSELVDLLLFDYDMLGPDFINVMQSIRRKTRGKNPFLVIVATVQDTAAETVQRLIGGGVDDLLRKPISIDRLFESIGNFTQERRPFFVSYNYVGPTRRSGQRGLEPANQVIKIPNSLRSRTVEQISDDEIERVVNNAVRSLSDKQIEALGIEIDVLAARVAEHIGQAVTQEDHQDVRGALFRMEVVADDLRKKSRGTQFERISELATMVIALTQRVLRSQGGQAAIEVQLLTKLASAIRRALSVERHSVEVMREISRTIADFTRSH